MDKFIRNIEGLVSKEQIDTSDLSALLSNVRKFLEKNNQKEDYTLLYFFCDWSSHPSLDRSAHILKMLDDLSEVWIREKDNDHLIESINAKIISFDELRKELIQFCIKNKISSDLFLIKDNWLGFLSVLLYHLSDIPLKRAPSKPFRDLSLEHIVSFEIINPKDSEDEILRVMAQIEKSFYYNLTTSKGLQVVGRIKYSL